MTAPDLEVAAVAICLLGDGRYPLDGIGEDAGQDVPAFLFGGHDEWFTSKFGRDFATTAEQVIAGRNPELADSLDSVHLDRQERSSLNDIGSRARRLAKAIRDKAAV